MKNIYLKTINVKNLKLNSDCKIWTGGKTRDGYGKTYIRRKPISVHRYSWILNYGEIPGKLFVLHKCDTPLCINPEHLFLGTHQDNMDDMKIKNRATNSNKNKTHCKRGHELSGNNLAIYINKYYNKEMRQCKKCRSERK